MRQATRGAGCPTSPCPLEWLPQQLGQRRWLGGSRRRRNSRGRPARRGRWAAAWQAMGEAAVVGTAVGMAVTGEGAVVGWQQAGSCHRARESPVGGPRAACSAREGARKGRRGPTVEKREGQTRSAVGVAVGALAKKSRHCGWHPGTQAPAASVRGRLAGRKQAVTLHPVARTRGTG